MISPLLRHALTLDSSQGLVQMSDGERAKTARVVLVRHGEGRANVDGVIAGLSGCKGLTELGQRQVETLSNAGGARVSGRMRCIRVGRSQLR